MPRRRTGPGLPYSVPAERCSSALASRGSSRCLHNSMRTAFAVMLMGSVHLMKLFHDFRRGTTPRCQLSGCLSSVACRVRSVRLATALLMYGHWCGDSGKYGQTVGVGWLQTAFDHSTGFIQCRVQFLCIGGALPHRACKQWRIQGGFLVAWKPPLAMLTPILASTFTSHFNLRLLETPVTPTLDTPLSKYTLQLSSIALEQTT